MNLMDRINRISQDSVGLDLQHKPQNLYPLGCLLNKTCIPGLCNAQLQAGPLCRPVNLEKSC